MNLIVARPPPAALPAASETQESTDCEIKLVQRDIHVHLNPKHDIFQTMTNSL